MKDNENNAESDSRIKEQAKEILMNERVDAIRSFWDIPGEKIYVDSLNLARTADRIVEIRDLFPKSVPVCFVVRECDQCELTTNILDNLPNIDYIYLPSSSSDDDFALIKELAETDGLFLSADLLRNISDDTLKNAGLDIDHILDWIEKRRLDY
jgi:hypothetical protein